jgi:hypothetical protein
MRHFVTLLLLCFTFSLSAQISFNNWGWGNEQITGNGEMTTETRQLDGFDGVSTCCNIKVELVQGAFSVKVKAESNLQEYIKTRVSGSRLEVGFYDKVSVKSRKDIIVYVSLPELDYVSASSNGEITCQSMFTGDELDAQVSSGAAMWLAFMGDRLETSASSGGRVEVRGAGNRIRADASSGGSVRAGDFTAKDGRCNASSGGGVTVNVSEDLNADASSGGSVRYAGNPSNVDTDTSSGGSVRRQ